ncbi:MAG: hypothetical protein MUD01_14500 [Chloroflexaceae bacterium]|nr:hypothetical protein [Chloroflexaceae bacterium]
MIVVTVLLAGAAFLLPIPLLVSALLAWIGIPLVAAFFPTKATTPSPPYQSGGQRV